MSEGTVNDHDRHADGATAETDQLVAELLDGKHRALARTITKIENRAPGYRGLVADLHRHTGGAAVVGITGSPGAGKSTLVDKLAKTYRDRGETVGIIAVDPSSPYSGGAVLGDRIRMASMRGDMDTFFRSMSARGTLGGLSTATADAVKALDAFGKDRIIVETVGAGQNEVDVVKTADTVVVLVQPGSGDDVQMLKAGILEIGDLFVVNKADMDGADRTVAELEEMIHLREDSHANLDTGHHGAGGFEAATRDAGDHTGHGGDPDARNGHHGHTDDAEGGAEDGDTETWTPRVVETVATTGDGVDGFVTALADHRAYLERSGELARKAERRAAEEVRQHLRSDVNDLVERELERNGGIDDVAAAIAARDTDPYSVAAEVVEPLRECLDERGEE